MSVALHRKRLAVALVHCHALSAATAFFTRILCTALHTSSHSASALYSGKAPATPLAPFTLDDAITTLPPRSTISTVRGVGLEAEAGNDTPARPCASCGDTIQGYVECGTRRVCDLGRARRTEWSSRIL